MGGEGLCFDFCCFIFTWIIRQFAIFFFFLKLWCLWKTARVWVFQSVQSLGHGWLFATPWTAALPASLSIPNSRSLLKLMNQWCHPTISSCVVPFSSCLQSFPASGSFPVRQFFASGGQSIEFLFHCFLAVWPEVNDLLALCFSFLIVKAC